LRPAAEVYALLKNTGFKEITWIDETAHALAWFQPQLAAAAAAPAGPPALGLHLLLGADFGAMFGNVLRNLAEKRAVVIQGVFDHP
jgi:hypothetical protein